VTNTESTRHPAAIGWGRAVLTGLVVIIVGAVASVGGANAVLTRATSLSRDVREYVATAVFLGVVIALAWALRRLQARGWI
jgi:hypothetical protein